MMPSQRTCLVLDLTMAQSYHLIPKETNIPLFIKLGLIASYQSQGIITSFCISEL